MQVVFKAERIEPTTFCPPVSLCACGQLDSVKTTVDRTATDVESLRTQITSVKEEIQNKTVKSEANLYILYLPSLPLPISLSLPLVLSSSVSLSPATHLGSSGPDQETG